MQGEFTAHLTGSSRKGVSARHIHRTFERRTLRYILPGLRLDARPNLLFHEKEKPGVDDEEDQHANAEALAFLEFRLCGPHQESSNILGVLLNRLGRAVGVIANTIAHSVGQ